MFANDTGYLNTRDTMMMPNDPFRTTISLVDALGQPVSLDGMDLRWRVVPVGTGMRMVTVLSAAVPVGTPNSTPLTIAVYDSPKGIIELTCLGDVLNDPRGYDWAVDVKPMDADFSLFRAVAKGHIQIFNQPRPL